MTTALHQAGRDRRAVSVPSGSLRYASGSSRPRYGNPRLINPHLITIIKSLRAASQLTYFCPLLATSKPNQNKQVENSIFGEIIHTYTRQQALEDEELIDVTATAREAGFRFPVALTGALWNGIESIPERCEGEDVTGRLWDVLWMASQAARKAKGGAPLVSYMQILGIKGNRKRLQTLIMGIGPRDTPAPVITIGFPEHF